MSLIDGHFSLGPMYFEILDILEMFFKNSYKKKLNEFLESGAIYYKQYHVSISYKKIRLFHAVVFV